MPLHTTGTNSKRAIVIGGSMAGLLAARVLADHFAHVTMIERDRLPDTPDNRKGVPQGRHAHVLLARGLEIMSQLFPGLRDALVADGAAVVDVTADTLWSQFGGYKILFRSGKEGLMMSRALIESHVRRQVLALANVGMLQECAVLRLSANADRTRITGVVVRQAGGEEELAADLVVDASGRGSRSSQWLGALGYPAPEETVIESDIKYVSRIYQRKPDDLAGSKAILVSPAPPQEKRTAVLLPIEGDRWILTLVGRLDDQPPTDEQGFIDFAQGMPTPDIYHLIQRAEPLTELVQHLFPANLRRRYERMARVPECYIVLGDALCSFNPIYGQGMTASALQALVLDACLRAQPRTDLAGLSRAFFRRTAKALDTLWTIATGEDLRYPEIEGPRPPVTRFLNWYTELVQQAAIHDREVYRAFFNVLNLTHAPTSLFHPGIVLRVLFRRRLVRQPSAATPALRSQFPPPPTEAS